MTTHWGWRKSRTIPVLLLWACMACSRVNFTFTFYYKHSHRCPAVQEDRLWFSMQKWLHVTQTWSTHNPVIWSWKRALTVHCLIHQSLHFAQQKKQCKKEDQYRLHWLELIQMLMPVGHSFLSSHCSLTTGQAHMAMYTATFGTVSSPQLRQKWPGVRIGL
jgi:hypothetical protein